MNVDARALVLPLCDLGDGDDVVKGGRKMRGERRVGSQGGKLVVDEIKKANSFLSIGLF